MIIQERDFLTDELKQKEIDPAAYLYIPHKAGASPGIVYPEDMFIPEEPRSAWEKESYQVLMQGLHGAAGASPAGWWGTFWSSITGIVKYILENPSTLTDILSVLVDTGVISSSEKEGMEGLTREEVAAIVEAKLAAAKPAWEKYLPWLIGGGLGIGLLAVLLGRRAPPPVYVMEK